MPGPKPSVRYWASRNGYCVKVGGVQHLLASGPDDAPTGPTFLAALDQFKRVLEKDNLDKAGAGNTVRAVLDEYLQRCEGTDAPGTFRNKLTALRLFSERWGEMRVADVKPYHAESIISEKRKERVVTRRTGKARQTVRWTDGSVGMFVKSLKAAFNWAVEAELIPANPLRRVKCPANRTRARERVLTQAEHETVLRSLRLSSSAPLRRLILALENTGARPGEIYNARVGDFDREKGALVYYGDDKRREDEFRHKSAGKKDRVIFFTGGALDMMMTLTENRPADELVFPNSKGKPYTLKTIVTCFCAIRARTKIKGLCAYSYRHKFATEWLKKGLDIDTLAELMGNTPGTIRKHYSHLCYEHEHLREKLERFRAT